MCKYTVGVHMARVCFLHAVCVSAVNAARVLCWWHQHARVASRPADCCPVVYVCVCVSRPACCCHTGILAHPWFSLGLPQGAMAMNESFLRMPRACTQSEEEIWRLIRHASAPEPRPVLDSCRLPWPFNLNTRCRSSNSNAASSEPCEDGSSPSVRLQTVA